MDLTKLAQTIGKLGAKALEEKWPELLESGPFKEMPDLLNFGLLRIETGHVVLHTGLAWPRPSLHSEAYHANWNRRDLLLHQLRTADIPHGVVAATAAMRVSAGNVGCMIATDSMWRDHEEAN